MIPGLWDMHVHARGTPALLSDNEAWLTLYIANGITSVREMGGVEDIRNTQKIDSVVLRGKPLMRDDLDNLLVHVATRAAAPDAGRPSS